MYVMCEVYLDKWNWQNKNSMPVITKNIIHVNSYKTILIFLFLIFFLILTHQNNIKHKKYFILNKKINFF